MHAPPGGSTEDELVGTLVDRGVNGIIFVSGLHADTTADMDRYVKLAGRGVPFVMINGYTEKVSAPFVSTDDRAAMRLAVSHLVELGHQRIGLAVGPRRFVPVQRKIEGFVQHCAPCCRYSAEEAEATCSTRCSPSRAARPRRQALIDQGCTAIVCGSDLMAFGAIRAARRRGLSAPRTSRWSGSTTRR